MALPFDAESSLGYVIVDLIGLLGTANLLVRVSNNEPLHPSDARPEWYLACVVVGGLSIGLEIALFHSKVKEGLNYSLVAMMGGADQMD